MTSRPSLDGPDFLIVGSARSGTTVAQRLACELPGVGMPPETHFFDIFVPQLLRRGGLPLEAERLRDEIERWRRLDEVRGLEVDVESVLDDLGGCCTRLVDLFDVLVRRLASPCVIYGEKTPKHLLWWRPLTRARPNMKIVALVRDPRSVVASNLAAPWARDMSPFRWGGDLYVAMAERWRVEQEQTLAMAEALGRRCLVLRYEDLVLDPAEARSAMASLVGAEDPVMSAGPRGDFPVASFVLPWETWKADALRDIDASRETPWRDRLSRRQGTVVVAICARVMRSFGYHTSGTERATGAVAAATLDPRTQRRRRAYRRLLQSELRWIGDVVG